MRLLRPASEEEMVASFLRAEVASGRYGEKLRALLARDGRPESVLRHPDLGSSDECRYRRALFDEHRAYDRREGLFLGCPEHVEWHRAALQPDELLAIRYINWHWWVEASGARVFRPTPPAGSAQGSFRA
jgi:hypothetical protein